MPDLSAFRKNGFQKLPFTIPPVLLQRLHELFDELMKMDRLDGVGVCVTQGKQYVTNLECLCQRGNLAALEMLGYPPVLSLAARICGPDFFLIQEFAVIKNNGDEIPVLWHQDMVHERKGECFTMGIYLDDVEEGDGALRVVPGSHLSGRTICELQHEPFIEIPAKAGEILIHDMMLAHASEPIRKRALRRVLYFEFLSAAHVSAESIYTEELVKRRSRLLYAATRLYESRHPGEQPFIHHLPAPAEDAGKDLTSILSEIYSSVVNARPSAYCFDHG